MTPASILSMPGAKALLQPSHPRRLMPLDILSHLASQPKTERKKGKEN